MRSSYTFQGDGCNRPVVVFHRVEIESEYANEQRGDSICRWNYSTQAKTRLEWATRSKTRDSFDCNFLPGCEGC